MLLFLIVFVGYAANEGKRIRIYAQTFSKVEALTIFDGGKTYFIDQDKDIKFIEDQLKMSKWKRLLTYSNAFASDMKLVADGMEIKIDIDEGVASVTQDGFARFYVTDGILVENLLKEEWK